MSIREEWKRAQALAEENLQACCQEIVEWKKTGVLKDGKVREIEAILASEHPHDATRMAEKVVVDVALGKIASGDC